MKEAVINDDNNRLGELLGKSYYVIDFLPQQVPKDASGQFFKIEHYLLNHDARYGLRDRVIRFILKLMCYYRCIVYWDEWIEQTAPEEIAEIVDRIMENPSADMYILFPDKNALITFAGDCLNLTLYNPDTELIALAKQLAQSEGMFCWNPNA